MNKVILMGRLTRDPEVRYSQGEKPMAVARYTLAVDRRFSRDSDATDFISCVAFGKTGEFAERYLRKGTKVAVTGRIQTGSYTNKDGVKVYTTDVVVEEHEFAESKNNSNNSNSEGSYGSGGYGNGSYGNSGYGGFVEGGGHAEEPMAAGEGFMNIPDGIAEELPFA